MKKITFGMLKTSNNLGSKGNACNNCPEFH